MPFYKCEKCNKEFNKKSTYDSHLLRLNPCVKQNIIYECIHCNKNYSNKYNLSVHINICKKKNVIIPDTKNDIEELKMLLEEQQKNNEELKKKVEELSQLTESHLSNIIVNDNSTIKYRS